MQMPEMQSGQLLAEVGFARPAGTPVASADGRSFSLFSKNNHEFAFWLPAPPREGDPVYCCGAHVGHYHGRNEPGECYLETVETRDLPANIAAHFRSNSRAAELSTKNVACRD